MGGCISEKHPTNMQQPAIERLTHNPSTPYWVRLTRAIEQGDWKTSWPLVGKWVWKLKTVICRTRGGALGVSMFWWWGGGGGGSPASHMITQQPPSSFSPWLTSSSFHWCEAHGAVVMSTPRGRGCLRSWWGLSLWRINCPGAIVTVPIADCHADTIIVATAVAS